MVGGGYYTITLQWSWEVVIASTPLSLAITTIIFGKHIDKMAADRAKGIYTLPVLLGLHLSRFVAVVMMLSQYILVFYMVFFSPHFSTNHTPYLLLFSLLAIPQFFEAFKVFAHPPPAKCPQGYEEIWPLWYVRAAFVHTKTFGMVYLLSLFADTLLYGG